jgi:hypothetical protein
MFSERYTEADATLTRTVIAFVNTVFALKTRRSDED